MPRFSADLVAGKQEAPFAEPHCGSSVRLGGVGTARPGGHTFAAFGEGFDMKRVSAACVIALGLVLGSGGAAMAGEVNGNGDDIPGAGNAASECAFSGLDTADDIEGTGPEGQGDDEFAKRGNQKHGYHGVQNFGMFRSDPVAKQFVVGFNPGMACRGNFGK